ncbi:hypothetical protein JOB18_048983 [Solea senegalensis]|uniref:Uncharacterized protein n=1 Tax=Solea senegalensis TaxID=28829 RepID=A0AAV6PIU9_SOLSE|nr:hypothetical protein JOB18_048983 [Solea senegalensis]
MVPSFAGVFLVGKTADSLHRRPSTQSAAQPASNPPSHLHITSSQPGPALPRTGNLQESSGLVLLWQPHVPKSSASIRLEKKDKEDVKSSHSEIREREKNK